MPLVKQKLLAIVAVVTTALVWGLMWYPFRVLNQQGISTAHTSLLVYLLAALLGGVLFFDVYRAAALASGIAAAGAVVWLV
jgi:hypothetical protein